MRADGLNTTLGAAPSDFGKQPLMLFRREVCKFRTVLDFWLGVLFRLMFPSAKKRSADRIAKRPGPAQNRIA